MERGLTLQDFARTLQANVALKRDIIAPLAAVRLRPKDQRSQLEMVIGDDGAYGLRDTAHDQVAEYTKIPGRYYKRMLGEAPALLAANVNRWFEADDKRMFRTLDGRCRAFLSDRYRRIENEEIANAALPILMERPGLKIRALEVTERRMYIIATDERLRADVKVGDAVEAGVKISNSEIGHGRMRVEPYVLRLICTNGMVNCDTRLAAAHVGRRIDETEDLNAIFRDDTRKADDNALLLKMRDVIQWAMSEAALEQAADKMRNLSERKITGDPVKSVEILTAKIDASAAEGHDILRALIEGGDLSAYGLMNAVTFQAHSAKDFDRAIELEGIGGQLTAMSAHEWEPILAAA